MRRWMKYAMVLVTSLILLSACSQHVPTWQEQYDLGVRYLENGDYEEAIIAFTAAIEIDPKRPEAYEKAAEAYMALGDQESALKILERGYEETSSELLRQVLERIRSESIESISNDAEENLSTSSLEEKEEDMSAYFDDPLSWDEVILGGVPFDNCMIETLSLTYKGSFSEDHSTFYAESGPHFHIEPGYVSAMYMNAPAELEFRGITYGMGVEDLLETLGFTDLGITFARQCKGSTYVFWDNKCFDAHADADLLAEGSYDFALCLHYSEESAYHMFLCCFREDRLEYIQISSQSL